MAVQQQFAEAWAPLALLADSFNQQLQQVESELAGSLLSLAVRLAEKLVQDHLQVNGRALEPVLRQVLDDLLSQSGASTAARESGRSDCRPAAIAAGNAGNLVAMD
ncbi:FliH/SctL family protein [Paludibacterium denitrificans]|uniref:FliH/SctL family protein n=1 Tax=Paludibacterium denitrificans TaxID=2675226 RepID=UPI001E55448B|nr:FliH/SctL family protein [Paludibacterium denitrificans]